MASKYSEPKAGRGKSVKAQRAKVHTHRNDSVCNGIMIGIRDHKGDNAQSPVVPISSKYLGLVC